MVPALDVDAAALRSLERLREAHGQLPTLPPPPPREPIHVVYGGAHLFKATTAKRLGELALKALHEFAPDARGFVHALGLSIPDAAAAESLFARVKAKLHSEPVEDFRIDFEDGYGARSDDEEDRDATRAGDALGEGHLQGHLPPFVGLRIKALTPATAHRGLRTLELFLTALARRTGSTPPPHLCVTLPKVRLPEEVEVLRLHLEAMESKLGWTPALLKVELMAELPGALVTRNGAFALPPLLEAAGGRCTAVHLGAYDYTAALGITAAHQRLDHPACDHARNLLQLQLSGSPVRLSDGATNLMPIGPHRALPGSALGAAKQQENREAVHRAWALSHRHIRHALEGGVYQGWDLHPAQLPVRYATVYAFFLEALEPAARRLRTFLDEAARATLTGSNFDDEASAQGLVNFFLRARACGALDDEELLQKTGLSRGDLQTRSFKAIREARTAPA